MMRKRKKTVEPTDEQNAQPQPDGAAELTDTEEVALEGGADDPTITEAEEEATAEIQERFATLQQERDELEQRLLRVSADYQNFVRRSEANITVHREQQLMDVARELVAVLDHFDHALAVDPEKTDAKSLLDGVEMVRSELLRTLARFGIEPINAQPGDEFDPNRHEALMRQPSEELESNSIAMQMQPGYSLKDKTIRAAKVAVVE